MNCSNAVNKVLSVNRHAQESGRLAMRDPGKEAQLDQFGRRWVQGRQPVQRFVERQQVAVWQRGSDLDGVQVHSLKLSAVTLAISPAGSC